jgi:outer membrane protein OmpA-like peptidoglycan-associated protein
MRFYLTCLISIFLMGSLQAQTNISISRKNFDNKKPGFKEAWEHVKNGDAFFDERGIWYNDAFNEYLLASVYNSSCAELNYKIGVSALFSDNKEEAAGFFLKAIELNKDIAPDVLLLTGRSLQYGGRYSEAIAKLNDYQTSNVTKSKKDILLANEYLKECNAALLLTKDTLRISIENAGTNINSPSDEYSEILTADGKTMYFASRRQIAGSGKRHPDTKFDENILVSHFLGGAWDPAKIAGKELTTKYSEAPLYVNSANNTLYIYSGSSGNGDIKVSLNKKGNWKTPEKVPYHINTNGSETSFTISPSGDEIYFVSDKGNNKVGGKDIYFIKKLDRNKWSKPQNAGRVINTEYDEEAVRFSRTGDTLFFSSRGHNSMGGFDIFYCTKDKTGEWNNVVNYGYPVNTPWDELFYFPAPDRDSTFYFASNRSGGSGGLDIYKGKIMPPKRIVIAPPPPKRDTVIIRDTVFVKQVTAPVQPPAPKLEQPVYLSGKVKDSDNGAPVLAKLDIRDIASNEIIETTASSDIDGSYSVKLPSRKAYKIDMHATGFLADQRRIDIPENWPKEVYNYNIDIIKVKVGKKVVLKNILFETGKSILTPGSYTELNRLLSIMIENEKMRIEISGHTDNTGSAPVNTKLSEARARAVLEYLVSKGVDRARMESKGFGSLQPISDNSTPAGRAKNRRVEFKILEF